MKTHKITLLALLSFIFYNCESSNSTSSNEDIPPEEIREYYQLKIYSFDSDEQVVVTDNYLKNAYIPAVKKLGINNIGVFKFRVNEEDSIQKTYVLTPFKSIDEFIKLDELLDNDEQYKINGSNYLNANYDQAPYDTFESIMMFAFEDFPVLQASKLDTPRSKRIYELRSYGSPTEAYYRNKVDMFNAGGEIKLFDRLGFNAVFYGEVISGPEMPNLMYLTTFSDRESRDQHWKDFVDSQEWKTMSTLEKYQNNMDLFKITLLYPTEYSDY